MAFRIIIYCAPVLLAIGVSPLMKRQRVGDVDRLSGLPREHVLHIASMLGMHDIPSFARVSSAFRYAAVSAKLVLRLRDVEPCVKVLEAGSRGTHKTLMQIKTLSCFELGESNPSVWVDAVSKMAAIETLSLSGVCIDGLVQRRALSRLKRLSMFNDTGGVGIRAIGRSHWMLRELNAGPSLLVIASWPAPPLMKLQVLYLGLSFSRPAVLLRVADVATLLGKTLALRKLSIACRCSDSINDEWVDTVLRTAASRSLTSFSVSCLWTAPLSRVAEVAALWPRMVHWGVNTSVDGKFVVPGGLNPMDLVPALRQWSSTLLSIDMNMFLRVETPVQFWQETMTLAPGMHSMHLWPRPMTRFSSDQNDMFPADLSIAQASARMERHPGCKWISLGNHHKTFPRP